jgi:hypothetical protein
MLDYILLNIAGTGDVNYAFIPLLLTAGQAALSISQGVSAANAAKEAAERAGERASEDAAEAAKRMRMIEQGNLRFQPEELKMSNKITEAFDTKMSRAAEDVAAESREQALATAASQGGNIAGAVDLFGEQARKDAIAGLTGRASAIEGLGQREQAIDQANTLAFNKQAAKEFNQADQMARAAELGQRSAEDAALEADRQKRQAIIGGAAQGAMGILGLTKAGGGAGLFAGAQQQAAAKRQLDPYITGQTIGGFMPGMDPATRSFTTMEEILAGESDGKGTPVNIDDIDLSDIQEVDFPEDFPEEYFPEEDFAAGGRYEFRDGGGVLVTDGEFSHETNKKAIVDEETGIKEGEMTGQEALIFNDEHVAIIEELTNRGDEEMLMMFMRKLLSQPQFQDEA